MLAIIRCLDEWDAELRGVKQFDICTDHKNLEYFMTVRRLTERQIRWSLILSHYNFQIVHVPGKENERADALSRRDQEMPNSELDERLADRSIQLLKPEVLVASHVVCSLRKNVDQKQTQEKQMLGEFPAELEGWDSAILDDPQYIEALQAVKEDCRSFPTKLNLKVSISECSMSSRGRLLF